MKSLQSILGRNKSSSSVNSEVPDKKNSSIPKHKKSFGFNFSNKSEGSSIKSPTIRSPLSIFNNRNSSTNSTVQFSKSFTFSNAKDTNGKYDNQSTKGTNTKIKKPQTLQTEYLGKSSSEPKSTKLARKGSKKNFFAAGTNSSFSVISEKTSISQASSPNEIKPKIYYDSMYNVISSNDPNFQPSKNDPNMKNNFGVQHIENASFETLSNNYAPVALNKPSQEPNNHEYNTKSLAKGSLNIKNLGLKPSKDVFDSHEEIYTFKIGDTHYTDNSKKDIFDNPVSNFQSNALTPKSIKSPLLSKISPPTVLKHGNSNIGLSSNPSIPHASSVKPYAAKDVKKFENKFLPKKNSPDQEVASFKNQNSRLAVSTNPQHGLTNNSPQSLSFKSKNNIFFDHSRVTNNSTLNPLAPKTYSTKENGSNKNASSTNQKQKQSPLLYSEQDKDSVRRIKPQTNLGAPNKTSNIKNLKLTSGSPSSPNLPKPNDYIKEKPFIKSPEVTFSLQNHPLSPLPSLPTPTLIKKASSIQIKRLSALPLSKNRSKTFNENNSSDINSSSEKMNSFITIPKVNENRSIISISTPKNNEKISVISISSPKSNINSSIISISKPRESNTRNSKINSTNFDQQIPESLAGRLSEGDSSNTANSAELYYEDSLFDQGYDRLNYLSDEPLALENSFELIAKKNSRKMYNSVDFPVNLSKIEQKNTLSALFKNNNYAIREPNNKNSPLIKNLTLNLADNIKHASLNKKPSRLVLLNLFLENFPEFDLMPEVYSSNVYPKLMIWNASVNSFVELIDFSFITSYSVLKWVSKHTPKRKLLINKDLPSPETPRNDEAIIHLKQELEYIQKQINSLPDKISRKLTDFNEANFRRHETLISQNSIELEKRDIQLATIPEVIQDSAAQKELAKLEKQHEKAKSKIGRLEAELNYIQTQLDETTNELEKEKDKSKSNIESLNSKIASLNEELIKSNKKIETLKKNKPESPQLNDSKGISQKKLVIASQKNEFKKGYNSLGRHIEDLELLVNELRKDVVVRGSNPTFKLIDSTKSDLIKLQTNGDNLKEKIDNAKIEWKKLWELELQNIIEEQTFIKHVSSELDILLSDSVTLQEMLETIEMRMESKNDTSEFSIGMSDEKFAKLMQLGGYEDEAEIEYAKSAVLEEITRTNIDHEKRLDAINQSERIRKLDLRSRTTDFQEELAYVVNKHKKSIPRSVEELEKSREEKEKVVMMDMLSSFNKN
ncbi:Bud site selection protein 6 [Smittium culicis]|uniref:Bud site selection protein 6 n=1 Tax=Smittium culicis TaxID=133412 RepID=A0A1R1X9Y8_9FUNG|nr:Bud site selection protein 6 [Smittium culicis]